jgi:hypothetical protein
MTEILDKLTSYNLFNYLLPGTLFAVIADKGTTYSFVQDDLVVGAFFYYFIGLVISRIGSLFIEPLLKKIGFLKFSDYKDFLHVSKLDNKIEELSESNNMYRTLCSLFFVLTMLFFYQVLSKNCVFLQQYESYLLVVMLFLLFLFSYRKQTNYIRSRIETSKKTEG